MASLNCLIGYSVFCFLIRVSFAKDLHFKEPNYVLKDKDSKSQVILEDSYKSGDHKRVRRHMEFARETPLDHLMKCLRSNKKLATMQMPVQNRIRDSFLSKVIGTLKRKMLHDTPKKLATRTSIIRSTVKTPVLRKISSESSDDDDDNDNDESD